MAGDRPDVEKALKPVRDLMERLRAPSRDDGDASIDDDVVLFTGLSGGLHLTGKLARLYRQCIDALDAVHGKNPSARLVSRTRNEELLRDAIFRTFRRPMSGENETRRMFERRLDKELASLRRALLAPSEGWVVTVRVGGLRREVLPFTLGTVEFKEGNHDTAGELASILKNIDLRREPRRLPHSVAVENRSREKARTELTTMFSADATASLVVQAGDIDAARRIGVFRVRQTVDIINFFASFLDEPRERQGRAFVAPDGPRTDSIWVVHQVAGDRMKWRPPWRRDTPVVAFDIASARAKEYGLTRAHDILRREDRTDLEQRLVTALSWAGRAKVEFRQEQACVLYAIALESLLTTSRGWGGVADRIRYRAAHLLQGTQRTRRHVVERVSRLYELRNAIVHAGNATDLDEPDLRKMEDVVNQVLTAMLLHEPYVKMPDARAFESWLEAQLLGGAHDEPGGK
jgi:hypothetical protein